ncbi:MAG: nitrogenase component 1 [Synergistaceae bacterium]
MRQTCSILSTYAADVSGVCSALYEMGGMTVMHDASGCNSTYNTHDEPRWYNMPSLVFISALSETEAMLGDEGKVIDDISRAALELHPRFIAVAGTPIPMMMGTDFKGLARDIEAVTGIPTFGFATNGMHSYTSGAGAALSAIADRFCDHDIKAVKAERTLLNLLGVTPLDFSITGNVSAMKKYFSENGFDVQSVWAMDSDWEELMNSGRANVNVVVSSSGLPLAETLKKIYGTPYVVGIPAGKKFAAHFADEVRRAAEHNIDINTVLCPEECGLGKKIYTVGEAVWAMSAASALRCDFGCSNVSAIAAADGGESLLGTGDLCLLNEDEIFSELEDADLVVADPLFKPALRGRDARFISFPHEGYSGRIFRKDIPIMVGEAFNRWFEGELEK